MRYISLKNCIFIFFILSCNKASKKEPQITFTPIKEITFNVGYPVSPKYTGTFKFKENEYFYFGDVTTKKCINIFTFNGDQKWNIPLNSVINDGGEIDDVSIISPDTIIILTLYTNKLYFIDRKGNCWKKLFLDSVIKPANGDKFEYCSSIIQDFSLNKNSLILHCSWRANDKTIAPTQDLSYVKYFYDNVFKAPCFLKITNIFEDDITYKFGLNNFYSTMVDSPHVMDDARFYYHYENKLFCFSTFSNKILEIDADLLTIKKEVIINSSYTNIGCKPIPINETTLYKIQDLVTATGRTDGAINRFLYDEYRKLFYVIVAHEIKPELQKENKYVRPWSFIIYDTSFNKLKEFPFAAKSYNYFNTIVCKEGILISNNFNTLPDYDKTKERFMLFKVSQ